MIKLHKLTEGPENSLMRLGWNWMLGQDTLPYINNEMVVVSETEAEQYYEATNQLYEMYVQAAEYVIENNLLEAIGIPKNLHEIIKYSWEQDNHFHLYGRFDLSGGIDNQAIKLIEFNADTATCIPETAVVQWAALKANQLDDESQFNTLFESLRENFKRIREMNRHLPPTILFSTLKDYPEDDTNVRVLMEAAREASFDTEFAYIDEVEFSASEGVYRQNPYNQQYERFGFWFKLIPWEYIADEPDLPEILTQIVQNDKAVVLNPAYTLIFQSKAILKILWDLFPNHPLLLETQDKPLIGKKSVEKVLFGREGANVRILESDGSVLSEADGDYEEYPKVYQEYVEFLQDEHQNRYQAGVFFAYKACGLGFRRGGYIIDNTAQFVGHLIGS
ncbi:MAG: glutathionylspermidine synthase family protein [Spirosomaceae bacterium]|jgi:glutathionylspermidine synthase|nr:glutathionylspermidine synthase family protein [Spirosomataceae bacterium]